MTTLNELTQDFLAQKRIAVAGVRRTKQDSANAIYKRLRDAGYTVFAINPNATTVEGDTCYPNLKSIPGGVDGVVIAVNPEATNQIVHECAEVGVRRVWIHRAMGSEATLAAAVQFCRENGIAVIPGACPLMYGPTADFGHKCMRWIFGLFGQMPKV